MLVGESPTREQNNFDKEYFHFPTRCLEIVTRLNADFSLFEVCEMKHC